MSWDPARYLSFAGHRLRPALDLMQRIALATPKSVVDLGCGPGNVTAMLRERWPEAALVGVDNSPEMLRKARHDFPAIAWTEADIAGWQAARPVDVIFSNAALHWVPDHAQLLPRLVSQLASHGVLAVQMPHNHRAPSHA